MRLVFYHLSLSFFGFLASRLPRCYPFAMPSMSCCGSSSSSSSDCRTRPRSTSAENDKLFILSLANLDRLRFGELSSGGLTFAAGERKQSSSVPCSHHRDLDKCRATRPRRQFLQPDTGSSACLCPARCGTHDRCGDNRMLLISRFWSTHNPRPTETAVPALFALPLSSADSFAPAPFLSLSSSRSMRSCNAPMIARISVPFPLSD